MKSSNWLRKLLASTTARRVPYRKAQHPAARPGVDQLEDRLVPSAVTQTFAPDPSKPIPQFANVSNTTFLGASFNQSASFGGIDSTPIGDFGANVNVSLAGQAGLNLTFTGTGGTVSPSYGATLNQSFTQPTSFGQVVSFTPQNTNVAINSGSVSTSTPSFGYGADVVAGLSGSLGGEFALFKDFSPPPFQFGGSMDIPLFAVNENGDGVLSVGGVPIFGSSDGLGLPDMVQAGLKEAQDFALGKSLEFGISQDPPLKIATDFEAEANKFTQDLKLELSLPKQLGPYKVPKLVQKLNPSASMDLGSLTEQAPEIAVDPGTSSLQAGGVVTATSSGTIAQLNLQVGALAGSLLGLAALGTTDEIKIGPANVQFTPVSFQLQPTLTAVQTLTLRPESQLTYTFTDSSGSPSTPDVILDGHDLGNVSSVTFTPGQDTVQIPFEGNAIKVTPSWEFKEVLTNEVDLNATLNATLTVGQITVNIPTLDPITVGPLYQQQFQFANTKLMTLLDQTTTVFDQTMTSVAGDMTTPQAFTIGQDFPLSTVVTTTADSDVAGAGSLRDAVKSADAQKGTNVIKLGAGTYQLSLAPLATDGSSGNLLVSKGDNLIIEGAGAGKTIIQANFAAGQTDRLFDVASGASLTLNGLTLEGGNPANSVKAPGDGGAVFQDNGSTLDVENCVITNNQAVAGGGIYCNDTTDYDHTTIAATPLTINNSTISNNTATGQDGADGAGVPGDPGQAGSAGLGGGVYLGLTGVGSQAVIENSTFAGNQAIGGAGGRGFTALFAGYNGGNGGNGEGGGLYVKQTIFINTSGLVNGNNTYLINDTFNGNTAAGGPGGNGGPSVPDPLRILNSAPGNGGNGGNGLGGAVRINEVPDPSGAKGYPDVLLNDTISGNTAEPGQQGNGPGSPGSNGSGLGGGAYTQPGYSLEAENTILAENSAITGPDMDGNITSGGTNLIGNTSGATLGSVEGAPADLTNVNPGLGALANNGGPTQTMAITPDSKAYGAGQSTALAGFTFVPPFPTTDQRGDARIANGKVDIGAFQYQYDLAVTGSVSISKSTGVLTYTFTVTNNGPDAATDVALTDTFPSNSTVVPGSAPSNWVSAPSGHIVAYDDENALAAGQSATFTVTVTPSYQRPQPFIDTATVSPTNHDTDTDNNSVTLVVQPPTEGQALQNALLYHFASSDPTATAANFSALVDWGDGSPLNNTLDGTGTVSVVASAGGGFDVLGSHLYPDEGNYSAMVNVAYLSAAQVQLKLASQKTPITNALAAPLPTPGANVSKMVLFHFVDPAASQDPASFTPIVSWGDGTLAKGGSAGVSVVADPAGGFDVVGSHLFANNVVGAVNLVEVTDSKGVTFWGPSLLHVATQPGSSDQITATWGDNTSSTVNGPLGQPPLLVTGNPAGGYDIVGDHAYTRGVSTFRGTALVTVAEAPLTAGAVTPPPVILQQPLNKTLLFHFVDPNPFIKFGDRTVTVKWGDGSSNVNWDATGAVIVVADSAGGFDVLGTHSYASNIVGAIRSVEVLDPDGRVFNSPGVFHFTDANPLATAADFTATVNWSDGNSNTTTDGSGTVSVVADPSGGFDVVGIHAYTQNTRNGTFKVSVADDGGASASSSTSFSVDYALTAGTLNQPAVTNEGDSISNALLFHFTDGDTHGQASDFTATVFWGDGTANTSADGSGNVTVSANTGGGFDVFGSHMFDEVPSGSTFGVLIQDVSGATTGASTTSFTVADPSVKATGGLSLSAKENADPGAQTVATFTDPSGAESLGDYSANINWGDGTPDGSGAITYDSTKGTFTVKGDHVYSQAGSDTITVTISHDQSTAVQVTDSAKVADVAVNLNGNFAISTVYGQSTGTQWVASFNDPGGASPLSDYQPTIDWGDNTTSTGTLGFDKNAPFSFASNLQTGNGPSAVATADLNGDGNLDLVVANATDNSVQIFLGNGDGTVQAPVTYSLGTTSLTGKTVPNSPTALAIKDLGNGELDIVTANSNTNTVSVLLGNGDGTFQTPTTLTAGTNPSAIALADLGNGHKDIVTANRGDNTVSVFLGNGDGTFGKATNIAAGTSPDGVAIGDVNGDSKPDLIVADAVGDSVSILIGNGDGTFQTATTVAVGSVPSAVALAHLTSSAHLDIVTANSGDNNVSVLLGNGDGTFQKAVNFAVGSAPVALLVTDTNGDGNQDIITANNGDNNVSVLAGNGDGTFGTPTNYALATGATAPVALAAGDLNGAGVLDLVTANSLSNNVTLLLPPYKVTGSHTYGAVSGKTPYVVNVAVAEGGVSENLNTGSVTVTPAALTISADDKSMTYGGTMPTLTATFTGLVNGDTASAVTSLSLSTVAASSHVGSYTITASGATDSNYTITLNNGTLQITPAALTITADDKNMTYGGTLPALTVSYSGLVNGDTAATFAASPNAAPTVGTTATSASHVSASPYTITVSGASDNDYTISYVQGGLTVTPAALSITADDKSMVYGSSLPTFTATYNGFVNQDCPANLTGTLSLSTKATSASAPAKYAITSVGQSSTDYTITYNSGTLTITPAPLSATGVNISATAGAPFSGTVATFTNADPYGSASSYTAVITWGDGSSSTGTISSGSGGTLIVSGTHTYAGATKLSVSVQISHVHAYTTTATTSATATVTGLGVAVQKGQAAGIGFWHNKNGQALIDSFNGGTSATALGNWLASNFSNLFGSLAGKTNSDVAAFYQTLFGQFGSKLGAEVMATALNVFATTSSLGGSAAQAYGFTVNAYGLGASSYNVGSNGAAFGVTNNTALNVYQFLLAANAKVSKGVLYSGDTTLIADAVNVFDGINTAGGI
jgi:uncharacterized repeat protein (TIGR01451 family)